MEDVVAQVDTEGIVEGESEAEIANKKTAAAGGAKKRGGQTFVSPRKKLLAKAAAKQGEKGKKGPSKAK